MSVKRCFRCGRDYSCSGLGAWQLIRSPGRGRSGVMLGWCDDCGPAAFGYEADAEVEAPSVAHPRLDGLIHVIGSMMIVGIIGLIAWLVGAFGH